MGALTTLLNKKSSKPYTLEALFVGSSRHERNVSHHAYHEVLEGFPYDMTFLSHDSLQDIITGIRLAKKTLEQSPWPPARLQAAMDDDVLAKRAAQSIELWEYYWTYKEAGVPITEDLLLLFAKFLWYKKCLKPPPRLIDRWRFEEKDPELEWQNFIGDDAPDLYAIISDLHAQIDAAVQSRAGGHRPETPH